MSGDQDGRRPAGSASGLSFSQTGRSVAMIGLCFKILLLSIVTLTVYRFWGRTQVRRYLWGHTVIDGEPLDYLGKGSELLIGFVIAFILYLVPLGIAINVIFTFWPPDPAGRLVPASLPWVFAVEIGFVYLVMVGLYQALRYRFSRTAWRGVRFSLTGSAFGFGVKALLLIFANLLLLGLLTPVMDLAIFGSIARNTHFGDKPFRFEGKARSLYGPFLLTYLLILLLLAGVGAGIAYLTNMTVGMGGQINEKTAPEALLQYLPFIIMGYVFVLLLVIAVTSFYAARSLRVKGSGLRFEGLSFKLDAHTLSYLWLLLSNLFLIIVTVGVALPITELRRFRYIFSRLSAEGTVDLSQIGQSTGPRPRFGEGLAEAFGMGNV
jgi:uncharacterized membrane protein YjgN (DUF898 family)